jgi:CheY-like chemotaxis protein/anti-sigma regulatory factor (Ser/Thr protein kinase)
VIRTDVLIVEKDYATRTTLCDVLLSAGWSVACAGSEDEALERLTTNTFRVALMDASLSDVRSVDTLRHRLNEMTPPGVIVMIGASTPEVVLQALKTQAYDFISRPVQADEVCEVIHRAVGAVVPSPAIEVFWASREWVEVSVPCTREAAERLQHFLNALEHNLEATTRAAVQLALRELLLNAVEWGGRLDATQRVRVARFRGHSTLVYRITDPGLGFRIDDLPHAAIGHQKDDAIAHERVREAQGMRAGGFGLVIVRGVADELVYNERGNQVTFVKYLADPAASHS